MQPPWMLADYYTKSSYPTERAGRLTGEQQTNKLKGIMSPISTLTPPHTLTPWGKQATGITCCPPKLFALLLDQNGKLWTDRPSQDSTGGRGPENENHRNEQRPSFTYPTGQHRLLRIPQHSTWQGIFNAYTAWLTTQSFLRCNWFLKWEEGSYFNSFSHKRKIFQEMWQKALALTANLRTLQLV